MSENNMNLGKRSLTVNNTWEGAVYKQIIFLSSSVFVDSLRPHRFENNSIKQLLVKICIQYEKNNIVANQTVAILVFVAINHLIVFDGHFFMKLFLIFILNNGRKLKIFW